MRRRYPHRCPRRRTGPGLRPWLTLCLLLLGLALPFLLRRPSPSVLTPTPASTRAEALFPKTLSPTRRAMVQNACALVGRVDYFWGGKSLRLGADPGWGALRMVTAEGSDTTGNLLPGGLDCSGLVTWAAVNAAGDSRAADLIGDGVRAQYSRCAPLAWADALPGDLAFFPDLSHVGIVAGWGADGALWVAHCSKSLGGVVLSEDAAATGFTGLGRPGFYRVYTPFTALSK